MTFFCFYIIFHFLDIAHFLLLGIFVHMQIYVLEWKSPMNSTNVEIVSSVLFIAVSSAPRILMGM